MSVKQKPDPDSPDQCAPDPGTAAAPLTGLGRQAGVLWLFFVSGAVGLLLQTLWMRELALLFGSTAWASATALAAFFLGLAAGSAVLGRFCPRLRQPLRVYGLLEIAVGVTASSSLLLLPAFHALYGWLYESWALASPGVLRLLKLGLALALLFPTAFFMGGTLPVLSRFLVRQPARMGRQVPLLYGLNTLGAALGAYAAAFVLPQWVGWRWTHGFAVLLALGVGGLALVLARPLSGSEPESGPATAASSPPTSPTVLPARWIAALALLSGFVTLALEVLWTRMFAQVLHNSVYSFAIVLILFLIALALGALGAAGLARLTRAPERPLPWLLTAGGLLVASTPLIFARLSDGLGYLGIGTDWAGYLTTAFVSVAAVLLVPTLVLGILFPYLMRIIEQPGIDVGATVGRLVALNTLGAIAGALGAGFLLLDWFGLWRSIQLLGALYLAAALLLPRSPQSPPVHAADSSPSPSSSPLRAHLRPRAAILAPVLGLVALLSVLDASRLPVVRVDPLGRGESLLQFWESGAGTVAVIRRGNDLRLKVDNHYTLGGSGGRAHEARQGHIPLLLHPQPRSVFFLGLGTGITAGAALHHAVERVEVAELLPEAITAARQYFAPWNNGLFEDERAHILTEDGRHHLAATRAQYDVIVGDLFVPWKAGVGGLYSLEHFRAVRARLAAGGLFAQWIPLYQISEPLFASIVRTFVEVFPHATLWRGDFLPNGPIVALVGHTEPTAAIDPVRISARMAALETQDVAAAEHGSPDLILPPLFLYYGGNLGAARALFADALLNTNARPIIELQAPRMQRAQAAGEVDWLRGEPLIALFERLQTAVPPEVDPVLANLDREGNDFVRHGLELFRARLDDDGEQRSARSGGTAAPVSKLDALRARLQALKTGKDALDAQLQRLDLRDGPPR